MQDNELLENLRRVYLKTIKDKISLRHKSKLGERCVLSSRISQRAMFPTCPTRTVCLHFEPT